MKDRMITIKEAAEIMQLSRETVYAMVRSGQLPFFIQLGPQCRSWRCSLSKLYDHLGLIGNFDDDDEDE